jgi:ATP-dependent helicase HepA
VIELAHTAKALLLLSATPVRSNEAGFLDLLHLLDPQHYQPDDLEDFVRRVELRDRLALTHQALTPDIDAFDLSLYSEELQTLFPSDALLATLLSSADSADDTGRPGAVGRVRDHLSETYRLHHRLLRTRRTPEIGETFRVRGRKRAVPFTLEVSDASDRLRRELLDSVRIHVAAASEEGNLTPDEALEVFRDVAQRCGSLSHALLPLIEVDDSRRSLSSSAFRDLVHRGVLPGWEALIQDIHQMHSAAVTDLGEVLSRSTLARGVNRTLLMSAYTESVLAVAAEMTRRWGADRVALHLVTQSRERNAEEVARWTSDGPCSLLLCDSSAEEGINLQNADLLIHLDLPWESFRVEQRIGRCDRHVRELPVPIPSTVVMYGDQPYALGWFEFLADGCDVFTRSVSSLQYILSDTERSTQQQVLRDGYEVLARAVPVQAATLSTEQTRIVAHDALDAVDSVSSAGSTSADDDLLASDQGSSLSSALVSWLEGVGANLRRLAPGAVSIERKPRPQVPFDLELAMAPSMGTPLALQRKTAVERSIPILRAGHPLVDAVAAHLQQSDRGVAFALFRPIRGQWPPFVVLRTDFLVSTSPGDALLAEADAAGVRRWVDQLVQDALPPLVETVIMTSDGVEIAHSALRQRYDKQRGDQNLSSRPDLFERLTARLDWGTTCSSALPLAQRVLKSRSSVERRPTSGATNVREKIFLRTNRERSRELAGLQDAGADLSLLAAAVPDRFEPSVDVLGCGVIFVGDPSKLE